MVVTHNVRGRTADVLDTSEVTVVGVPGRLIAGGVATMEASNIGV